METVQSRRACWQTCCCFFTGSPRDMGTRWAVALLPFYPRIHLCGILAHWFTPVHWSVFENTQLGSKSLVLVSYCGDSGTLPLVGMCLCYSTRCAYHLLSDRSVYLLLSQPHVLVKYKSDEQDHDPHGSFGVAFMFCWKYWWDLAVTKPPRHKHFFYWALPNKTVINKTPALLLFQHPKAKQDAEAAETLPRCLSWSVRDWPHGKIVLLLILSSSPHKKTLFDIHWLLMTLFWRSQVRNTIIKYLSWHLLGFYRCEHVGYTYNQSVHSPMSNDFAISNNFHMKT